MNHEEKTQEIELPGKRQTRTNNLVRVDFASAQSARVPNPSGVPATVKPFVRKSSGLSSWWNAIDLGSPIITRLLIALTLLALSLLIL